MAPPGIEPGLTQIIAVPQCVVIPLDHGTYMMSKLFYLHTIGRFYKRDEYTNSEGLIAMSQAYSAGELKDTMWIARVDTRV